MVHGSWLRVHGWSVSIAVDFSQRAEMAQFSGGRQLIWTFISETHPNVIPALWPPLFRGV